MKRITKYLTGVVEVVVDLAFIPLFFVKIFHEVAVLPVVDAEGNQSTWRVDYYYSPLQNLQELELPFFIYIAIALLVASAGLAVATMVKDCKKLRIANYVVFAVAVTFAVFVILLAFTVVRNY
jgi:hypothetical protein